MEEVKYVYRKGRRALQVTRRGYNLIRHPILNKGTAFTLEERRRFGLEGILPNHCMTIDQQASRVYASLCEKDTPMGKHIGLTALQNRNEHLFYRVLVDHLEEFMPVIYTPTVGQATRRYSHDFRRGRGLWITPDHRGRIKQVLEHGAPFRDVRLIVVTDNESILGIGDQGAGGIAISIGKLALYTAAAGIHPAECLPISLDVGTNNEDLLNDPLYLGWPNKRLRGKQYDSFIEEYVDAVKELFPRALIQWEDFRKDNALGILDRYRESVLSFNDDIQGTGAVALAAVLSALRVTHAQLTEQRIAIFGAGAAGLGIARQLRAALLAAGVDDERCRETIAVLDSQGLLVSDRDLRDEYKKELAWSPELARQRGFEDAKQRGLHDVVDKYRPTVLIGASGQAGAFDEEVVRGMAVNTERPLVLPFSNPTDNAEAVPEDVIRWSEGRALVATGSPFAPVEFNGRQHVIGQGNNVFIFPGLGLGALLGECDIVTDNMVTAASRALAECVTDAELETGLLFPNISRLRESQIKVAAAVIRQAAADEVLGGDMPEDPEAMVEAAMWKPEYLEFIPA